MTQAVLLTENDAQILVNMRMWQQEFRAEGAYTTGTGSYSLAQITNALNRLRAPLALFEVVDTDSALYINCKSIYGTDDGLAMRVPVAYNDMPTNGVASITDGAIDRTAKRIGHQHRYAAGDIVVAAKIKDDTDWTVEDSDGEDILVRWRDITRVPYFLARITGKSNQNNDATVFKHYYSFTEVKLKRDANDFYVYEDVSGGISVTATTTSGAINIQEIGHPVTVPGSDHIIYGVDVLGIAYPEGFDPVDASAHEPVVRMWYESDTDGNLVYAFSAPGSHDGTC